MSALPKDIPTMMLVPADQFLELSGIIRTMASELSELKKLVAEINPPQIEDEGLKTKEAAEYLGVSIHQLRKHLKDEIGYIQRKRSLIFQKADLEEYKKRYKVERRFY